MLAQTRGASAIVSTHHIEQSVFLCFDMITYGHKILSCMLIRWNCKHLPAIARCNHFPVVSRCFQVLVTENVSEFSQQRFWEGVDRTLQGICRAGDLAYQPGWQQR